MYKFKIHNGNKDYIIIEGETIKECREKANIEAKRRGWKTENLWSELIN